jgi:Family of unknown function (DUF6527)
MQYLRLEHRFVDHIPDAIEPGVLYVSIKYATAAHRCCCGCGHEVITPFTPTDWRLIFDGESVTLSPSIGSWSLACRSHYVIDKGRVVEAGPWSDEEVAAERARDRRAKARYYDLTQPAPASVSAQHARPEASRPRQRVWQTIRGWLKQA